MAKATIKTTRKKYITVKDKEKTARFKQLIEREGKQIAARRRKDKISRITITHIVPALIIIFVFWDLLKQSTRNGSYQSIK